MCRSVTGHRKFDQPQSRLFPLQVKQQYNWNYTTTPQPGLNGRSVSYPRGRVLGGSSSISKPSSRIVIPLLTPPTRPDYMAYHTGSRDDWDYISRITGDPAWTWDAMSPYRDLNQKYVAPNDGHDDVSKSEAGIFPAILDTLPRQINTFRRHIVAAGWYPSVFLGTRNLSTQESLQPQLNQPSHPSSPSNGT